MITHRLSTQPPPEPPVRLYKVIALTFLTITLVLLGTIIFVTSKKATIVVITKEDKKPLSLIVKVNSTGGVDAVVGVVTSTVFSWSEKFQVTSNKTIDRVAIGEVTIYNKGNASQVLIKTTRLLSPQGVLFHLSNRETVPANGQITAAVYADQPGTASVIGPSQFSIPGLSSERQKFVYAQSKAPMQGGSIQVGILSDEDIKTAEKRYKEKVREAYTQSLPPAVNLGATVVATISQTTRPNHPIGEEVSDFIMSGSSTMVAVRYDARELGKLLDGALNNKVDLTVEKFLSVEEEPRVTLASYDVKTGSAELNVEQNVIVTLDANIDNLAPQHFLGRKKDEIERYVIGLDHVDSTKVTFFPSWMSSAPTVPDRIKVIVKSVR